MDVTLVIPGLLDAPASSLDAAEACAPVLAGLLATAPSPVSAGDGIASVICGALGIARQRDWPVAPWLARAAGIEDRANYWLCADPATFTVGSTDVRMAGLVRDLSEEHSAALLSALNGHFSGDAIRFFAPAPSYWLIGAEAAQALQTFPPDNVAGEYLADFLTMGPDAPRWRRWQNEIQMLFFEHRVNRERERAGRAVVNAVWLWGSGTLSPVGGLAPSAALYADSFLPRELARARGAALSPLPPSFSSLRGSAAPRPAWIWMKELEAASASEVVSHLRDVDQGWLGPLREALTRREVSKLDIVLTGHRGALRFNAKRRSFTQRLRLGRPRARLAATLAVHQAVS
jgi:hypothetical protein